METSRAPLTGRPERALEALRAVGLLARWLLTLGVPFWLLPLLAPGVRSLLPPGAPRWGAALVLTPTAMVSVAWLGKVLLERLHLGRRVHLGTEELWVSHRRLPGRAWFQLETGECPGEPGWRVPLPSIQRLFRVSLPGGYPPMVSVGVWYLGEDGRAREMWLYLEPGEADPFLESLAAASGQEVLRPRPLDRPLASEEVGQEEEQG